MSTLVGQANRATQAKRDTDPDHLTTLTGQASQASQEGEETKDINQVDTEATTNKIDITSPEDLERLRNAQACGTDAGGR